MRRFVIRTLLLLVCLAGFGSVYADSVFPVSTATVSAAACQQAVTHDQSKDAFCTAGMGKAGPFGAVTTCNCKARHAPAGICNDPRTLYSFLKSMYRIHGSEWLKYVCQDGHDGTSIQECEDQWNCFMYGTHGTDATQKISDGECFGQTDVPAQPCSQK